MNEKEDLQQEEKSEEKDTKALKAVTLRNKFFYLFYRNSLFVLAISLVLFVCSLFFVYLFSTQPVAPLYIPLKENGQSIELVRINEPHKTDQEVADFVLKGVKKLYTRDYINYSDQLMEASAYFTPAGFNSYLDSLEAAATINAIKQNSWVVSFTPRSAPILLEKKVDSGAFTWAFEVDGVVDYHGGQSGRQQNLKIKLVISRVSVVDSPYGMGIRTFVPFEEKN